MGEPKQKMDDKTLRRLVPLNALSDENFNALMEKIRIEDLKSGDVIFKMGDEDSRSVYLLSGKLTLIDRHKKQEILDATDEQSRFPIAHHFPRQYSASAKGPVQIVRIDTALLDSHLTADETETYEVSELHEEEEGDWMTRMLNSKAFEKLSPSNLQALFMHMQEVEVKEGDVIIHEGDEGDFYYTIKDGKVEVTRQLLNQPQPATLAVLGSGEAFGEEALIFGSRRNATVTMKTDGSLMRLDKNNFERLLKEPLINIVPVAKAISMIEGGAVCVDVRTPQEFQNESLRGSNNIPMNRLRNMIKQLNPSRTYILCCETGNRSAVGAFLLAQRGFDALVMEGGLMNIPSDVFNRLKSSATKTDERKEEVKGQGAEIVKFSDGQRIEDQTALQAEREKYRAQAEAEKKKAIEEAMRIKAEAEAMKKKAQEELARLKSNTEAARKKAEDEAKRLHEEAEKGRKAAEEEAEKMRKEIEDTRKRVEQEAKELQQQRDQLLKEAHSESEKLKALTEEERKKVREETELLREKAKQEADALRTLAREEASRAREEAERLKAEQEEAKKQAELASEKLKQETAVIQQRAEEAARLKEEAEKACTSASEEAERLRQEAEEAQEKARKEIERMRAEGEEAKRSVEEEINQLKTAADAAKKHLEAEKARLKEEEESERLRAESEIANLAAKAEEARMKAEEEERRKVEAEAARLKAQEEAARLRAEAEETRAKMEDEVALLKGEAESVLRKAEEESERLLKEAEQARSGMDDMEDAARKEMEEKANTLFAEAEKMRIKAQEEANRLVTEAEQARIKAQEEAASMKMEAENARLKAEEEAARIKMEAETASLKAQEDANILKSELEETKIKVQMEAARLKAEHEQARRRAEEHASWLEKEVEQANETGSVDLERALLTGGPIKKQKIRKPIPEQEESIVLTDSTSRQDFSESVSISFTREEQTVPLPAGSGKKMIAIAAVVVIVIIGAIAGYMMSGSDAPETVVSLTEQKPAAIEPEKPVVKEEPKVAVKQEVPQEKQVVKETLSDRLREGGSSPLMVKLPAGTYMMGSPSSSPKFEERPQHEVVLKAFAISMYEVTVEDYNRFANSTGRTRIGGDHKLPARKISWENAVAYTEWLSKQTGNTYRLPTEAEWEYAARAKTESAFWWGVSEGNNNAVCFNCGSQWDRNGPAPVGSFTANDFGLHDMSGNVMEWVQDCYHRNYEGAPVDGSAWTDDGCSLRVARGGAYDTVSDSIRVAKRNKFPPNESLDNMGIRLVREL